MPRRTSSAAFPSTSSTTRAGRPHERASATIFSSLDPIDANAAIDAQAHEQHVRRNLKGWHDVIERREAHLVAPVEQRVVLGVSVGISQNGVHEEMPQQPLALFQRVGGIAGQQLGNAL